MPKKYWTDYPFTDLGDEPYVNAPIRECELVSYDGDKYVRIRAGGKLRGVKAGYVYPKPGRCGEVPSVSRRVLNKLPVTLI